MAIPTSTREQIEAMREQPMTGALTPDGLAVMREVANTYGLEPNAAALLATVDELERRLSDGMAKVREEVRRDYEDSRVALQARINALEEERAHERNVAAESTAYAEALLGRLKWTRDRWRDVVEDVALYAQSELGKPIAGLGGLVGGFHAVAQAELYACTAAIEGEGAYAKSSHEIGQRPKASELIEPLSAEASEAWEGLMATADAVTPPALSSEYAVGIDWALRQGDVLADWCNVSGAALAALMDAYERRIRSLCTPEQINTAPWRCAEFIQAERALASKPVAQVVLSQVHGFAAAGNYVADREVYPQRILFANGRTVELKEGALDVGWARDEAAKVWGPK